MEKLKSEDITRQLKLDVSRKLDEVLLLQKNLIVRIDNCLNSMTHQNKVKVYFSKGILSPNCKQFAIILGISVLSIVPLTSSFELQPKALVIVPPPTSGAP